MWDRAHPLPICLQCGRPAGTRRGEAEARRLCHRHGAHLVPSGSLGTCMGAVCECFIVQAWPVNGRHDVCRRDRLGYMHTQMLCMYDYRVTKIIAAHISKQALRARPCLAPACGTYWPSEHSRGCGTVTVRKHRAWLRFRSCLGSQGR